MVSVCMGMYECVCVLVNYPKQICYKQSTNRAIYEMLVLYAYMVEESYNCRIEERWREDGCVSYKIIENLNV